MLNVDYRFKHLARWARTVSHTGLASLVFLWAVTGAMLLPAPAAAQCRTKMLKSACHGAMQHGEMNEHACCNRKPQPPPSEKKMPCCPMHEGMLPTPCGGAVASCCPDASSEETNRRSARTEKNKSDDQHPEQRTLAAANAIRPPSLPRNPYLRDGTRYERPVFELKTDLRI